MTATMLADRALLRLGGDDVRGFLQGLVSNDLGRLAPDRPLWTGLLTPQGKALFDFIIWSDGADVLADVEEEQADALARRFMVYRLRRPVTIAREPAMAVHWSLEQPGVTSAVHDPRLAALGWRWLAPFSDPVTDRWHPHRLSLGVTEGVGELGNGESLWLECNAAELDGVSFTKGCYVGQENTARMHYRNKVNRRLVVEPLTNDEDPRVRQRYPHWGCQVAHRRADEIHPERAPSWLAEVLLAEAAPADNAAAEGG